MTRLLVVDDERKLAVVLAGELTDAGHNVVVAQDGISAAQLINTQPFEIGRAHV